MAAVPDQLPIYSTCGEKKITIVKFTNGLRGYTESEVFDSNKACGFCPKRLPCYAFAQSGHVKRICAKCFHTKCPRELAVLVFLNISFPHEVKINIDTYLGELDMIIRLADFIIIKDGWYNVYDSDWT
jgi:hypothetical protein